jgi:hypothetical protein
LSGGFFLKGKVAIEKMGKESNEKENQIRYDIF